MEVDKLPKWVLKQSGEYFLVVLYPDGAVEVDGGHSDIKGVITARKLYRRLFNKPGTEFIAIQIIDIPDIDVPINEGAADSMAKLLKKGGIND